MHNTKQALHIEEDEIDLRKLFTTIWKYKIFIVVFVFIITILSILYAVSKPNQYKVYAVLEPKQYKIYTVLEPQSANFEGHMIEGINIGEEIKITPDIYFKKLLKNYTFMKKFIIEKKIIKKLLDSNIQKDYKFTLNYNRIYKYLDFDKKPNSKKIDVYLMYKLLSNNIKISTNKETDIKIINISFIHPSRHFAYYVLTSFLEYGTKFLVNKNLQNINSQINNYQKELKKTGNLELKADLVRLIASLIKQRIYINSSKYYKMKLITAPYIPDVEDKAKPRRSFIVIGAFIASFILSIFLAFFIEFIKEFK